MGIATFQTDSKLSITLLGWNVKDFSSWEKMFRPRKGKIEERTSSFEVQKQVTFDKLLQTNPRLDFFSLSIQLRKFVFDGFLWMISNEMFIFFLPAYFFSLFFRFSTLIAHDRSDSEDPIARFVCESVHEKEIFLYSITGWPSNFTFFRSKFSSLLNHKNGRQDRSYNNEDVYQLEDYLEHRRNDQGYHHQFQRMPKQYGFGENRRNLPIEPIEPMPTFDIREDLNVF